MINQCCVCGKFFTQDEPVIRIFPYNAYTPRFDPHGSNIHDRLACATHLVLVTE